MSKSRLPTATQPAPADADPTFGLETPLGPAIVAGERLSTGDRLDHAEYGVLELTAVGHSNGALGTFVRLVPVDGADVDAGDVPAKWSLDRGAPNSLPDAHAAGEISVVGGETEDAD